MLAARSGLALLCLGFLAFTPALSAQKSVPQKITFSGVTESSTELLAVTGLKAGDPVGQPEIQAAAQKLIDTGMFSDVRFSFDGVDLHYELKPAETMEPVRFDNFPWWDAAALNAAVAAKVPLFHGSVPPQSGMQQAVAAALTALLATKGVTATVTGTPAEDPATHEAWVDFAIDTPPVQVGSVDLDGVTGGWFEPVGAIQKAAVGEAFDPATEAKLAAALRAIYHRQGFLDETMTGFAHGAPRVTADKILVPVSATVVAGSQYHLLGLHLSGDTLMTPDEFAKKTGLHPGDVANEDLLRGALLAIGTPYRQRGYLRAKINATPTKDAANHTVDYTITVEPGPVFHMGKLTLTNLNEQQIAEVQQCWPLHEGDAYDAVMVPQFLNRYKNQLHSLDGWSASYKAYEHEDTHVVDLAVTFQQAGPLR
jgi:outer membrane protein insertion porin family